MVLDIVHINLPVYTVLLCMHLCIKFHYLLGTESYNQTQTGQHEGKV